MCPMKKIGLRLGILQEKPKGKRGKEKVVEPPPAPPAPAPIDPRLPLTARQKFSIMKSWKGISRSMEPTGIFMFIKLFENHYELLNLFEKFQGLKTRDEQAESMELADHAGIVMTTLDKGIKSLDNIDEFFQYVHTVGASHTQIPGFKKDNFGKIKEPFLYAVRETLQERYTTNIEVIYKITIDFIIDTLVEGYEKALQCQENAVSSTED